MSMLDFREALPIQKFFKCQAIQTDRISGVSDVWKQSPDGCCCSSRRSPAVRLMRLANIADVCQRRGRHTICFTLTSLCVTKACWPRCIIELQVGPGECVVKDTHGRASISCRTVGNAVNTHTHTRVKLWLEGHAGTWQPVAAALSMANECI